MTKLVGALILFITQWHFDTQTICCRPDLADKWSSQTLNSFKKLHYVKAAWESTDPSSKQNS